MRVAALNAGGESLPGRVGGVQVGAPGGALVVDAFDRPFVHSARNTAERYSYDGSIAHVDALGRGSSTLGVDFAEGSAVHAGRVPLDRYDLVDWALGQNAPDGDAFDLTERRLLTAYVDGGGALLASGAELDWDRPVPLAPAAVADPRGPVVLGPPPPVRRARYGWREGEAVVRTGPQRVATVEFPLESVDDPAHRAAIAAAVLRGLQVRSGDGPGFVRVLGR